MAVKKQITFKVSDSLYQKITSVVGPGQYPSQSAVCEEAVTEFFLMRDIRGSLGPELKRFFDTPEGKTLLGELFAKAAMIAYQTKECNSE